MHKRIIKRKIRQWGIIGFAFVLCGLMVVYYFSQTHTFAPPETMENISIVIDGRRTMLSHVPHGTVGDVLATITGTVSDRDQVFPSRDTVLYGDDVITITTAKHVHLIADGDDRDLYIYDDTVQNVLVRSGVVLDDHDIIKPHKEMIIRTDMDVQIIRVEYREEVETEKIAFKTIEKEDDELSFRERIVEQKGKKGEKTITYRVAYHDGEEVDRALVSTEVTTEPADEVIVQGTYVKLGKKHTGACSWYAHTGTLAAANPWLPMGSYVKVTNVDNGKSVIVKINDRGPFVPGRIIDLDKVAFAEIASVGAGVINVKMEEIIN